MKINYANLVPHAFLYPFSANFHGQVSSDLTSVVPSVNPLFKYQYQHGVNQLINGILYVNIEINPLQSSSFTPNLIFNYCAENH